MEKKGKKGNNEAAHVEPAHVDGAQVDAAVQAVDATQASTQAASSQGAAQAGSVAPTTATSTEAADTAQTTGPTDPYEKFLASIIGTPIKHPLYVDKDGGLCESEFTGPAIVRVSDLLFCKTKSGGRQILVRGVVVEDVRSDVDLMTPEERAASPDGFTAYSLRPGNDDRGFVGYGSVVGYPFVTVLNLAEGFPIENAMNTLRAFGWGGRSFRDFQPVPGEQTVLASKLGMSEEMEAEFKWKEADAERGFAARTQLGKVSPRKNTATADDADICDKMFEDYIAASMTGRVDTKKKSVEGAAARIFGRSEQPAAKPVGTVIEAPRGAGPPRATVKTAGRGAGAGAGSAEQAKDSGAFCGKMIKGEAGRLCSKAPGHQGACGLLPFNS